MADPCRTTDVLSRLARIGVRLSIDDFGTGYSSLALPEAAARSRDQDRPSFVIDLMTVDEDDAAIVRSIDRPGPQPRARVVAEGVETEATWHRLPTSAATAPRAT